MVLCIAYICDFEMCISCFCDLGPPCNKYMGYLLTCALVLKCRYFYATVVLIKYTVLHTSQYISVD
jgi:hypothetical protein